ncbi:APC family permease [Streptomyces arenae]|uniref:APC family permease n=1 Tax=Streptomyces arenae TaxID=29301 RepID=UPI002657E681|nr:APC family permease [Streptomyces arenae]MCG7205089.1 APC family permease [Streptomyces arenae]
MANRYAPPTPQYGSDGDHTAGSRLQRGTLNTNDIVFFVVAAAAPLTVMAGVAPLAIQIGGIGAPAAYLAVGVVLVLFSTGFTAMTPYIRNAGAFYAYIARGLGRPAGVGAALLAMFSYNALQIGTYGAFGFFAASTVDGMAGIDLPWPLYAAFGVITVWFLGFRSINLGAKVLAALLIAETAILVLLAVAVLLKGGASGFDLASFSPSHVFVPEMIAPLLTAVGAFIGYEATVIFREEARRPDRTVPRATYVAVIFLAVFYTFVSWIIVQAFGSDRVVAAATDNPAEMFFIAMDTYVGGWASDIQRILIVTSLLAALLAFHNAITRYAYALASEKVFPASLGRVHLLHGSPWIAGIAQSVVAAVVVAVFALSALDPYTQFFLWVNTPGILGLLILQALGAFAVVAFFRRNPPQHGEGTGRTLLAPVTAGVLLSAATVCIATNFDLFTGAGPIVNWTLVALTPLILLTGIVLALRIRRNHPARYDRLGTTEVDAA